jgi:hypothetical protein
VIPRSLLALVMLAGAAACAPRLVVLSPTNFYIAYTPTVVNSAAGSGGILVEVIGNPFDAPQADLERTITSAMTGSHFGPPVDFVTTPPEDFRSPYRIVMVFDAAQAYGEAKLCREGRSIVPSAGDQDGAAEQGTGDQGTGDQGAADQSGQVVKVYAALCAGQGPLTGVNGRVGEVTGLDDPKFRQLISQLTTNLLPPFNPDRRDGGSEFFSNIGLGRDA